MLDVVECSQRPVNMPVDYASYLLASSPPGAGFQFLSRAYTGDCPITIHSKGLKQFSCFAAKTNGQTRRLPPLKPIIVTKPLNFENDKSNNADHDSDVDDTSLLPVTSTTATSADGKRKKRVSFADHKGHALATVRIMTEPSDVPPKIRPEILSALTKGASAGVTDKSPLSLNFTQPASDYALFRDRLEKDCVSLENVILKDYSLMGTIKVKNISFDKSVFVRVTFDSWDTFTDLPAVYAANTSEAQGKAYDTFTFEIHVPTNYDRTKKIMFAVCFISDSKEYWDSNHGQNYEVISDQCKPSPESKTGVTSISQVKEVGSWTEFACWNHVDTTLPYW
ncbi:protein phosphatase 1 regulatory subunit 3B-like [Liolophura sinensis]|uniref:protein phosphatase 1 regulatory subunit 3B-like n=1 Tax=Liolophura sinensis TaxID=3198878 RepID=UPI003158271F